MSRALAAFLVIAAFGSVAACTSTESTADDTNAACGAESACGGDIVGTWNVTGSCVVAAGTAHGCPQPATLDMQVTGSVTFNADLSYTYTYAGSQAFNYGVPDACLTQGGARITCDQIFQLGDSTVPTTCTPAVNGGCACVGALSAPLTDSGTYTTQGSLLITTSTGSPVSTNTPYCVKGGQMVQTVDLSLWVGPSTSTVVFQKQ